MKKTLNKLMNIALKTIGAVQLVLACCILYTREPVTQEWPIAFITSLFLGWLFLILKAEPSDKNT